LYISAVSLPNNVPEVRRSRHQPRSLFQVSAAMMMRKIPGVL
jgi:hypothetical protein